MKANITASQYQTAAAILGCEIPVIKAVAAVESSGAGFLADGRIKILFEPHIFWRQLRIENKLNWVIENAERYKRFKDILYERPGLYPYGTYKQQWMKLERAREINADCANKACSWGKFQPMGLYHEECGFATVSEMIKTYEISEYQHLLGFVRMIKARKLDDELRRKDWNEFALRYNGSAYKKNGYHTKLAATYKKLLSVA